MVADEAKTGHRRSTMNDNEKKQHSGRKPRRGDVLDLEIDSLSFGGAGVARTESGMVVFVPGTVPGDKVKARVRRRKKGYVEATVSEMTGPSKDRIEPRCDHFDFCGGCKWQSYPYELQLQAKEQQVRDCFERIAGFDDPPIEPITGMERPWEYRNKMEYTFSQFKDGRLKLGLHQPGFYDRIIAIERCHLQPETCDCIRNTALAFCSQRGLSAHFIRTHEGLMRNLVIRTARSGTMVCIVTHSEEFEEHAGEFADELTRAVPGIQSIYWYVNTLMSGVAIAGEAKLIYGEASITEVVSGLEFGISPPSFFQTNTTQCGKLYELAEECCGLAGGETVYDVYTGMAPIAMLLARRAGRVVGVENNPQAVDDGRKNIAANGFSNVELVCGEAEKVLPEMCSDDPPDSVVADPPRAGIHRKALDAIASARPRTIVYISCNPSTLARDSAELAAAGYELVRVKPVDMFPHTVHIECVTKFSLRNQA